jgi:hypothetical protein
MAHSNGYSKLLKSAHRSRGSSGYRRGLAVLLTAAVLLATELVGTGVVEAKSTTKPPPIPNCYYTGSGYGSCEGYVIPGGGSVVPLTVANKTDEFKLQGPAPLQWTKPVACGDLGCVYNHLDWFVAPGLTVVKGCTTNVSICWVTVSPGTTAWVPVYVRQNNDSPTIYLIFNSGTPLKKGGHLQMSVTSSATSGSLEVSKTATISVKLTAIGGAVHSIVPSALTLSSASLTTPSVTPASGFSLAKDTSRVLRYTVTGASEGSATVTASAQGIDAVGRSTAASGALSFQVGVRTIAIRVVTAPYKVELKVDDHGNVLTEQIDVKVTLTNTTTAPVEGVKLLSLRPVPVDPTQQLDQLAFAPKALPLSFGTLAAKSSSTKTFSLDVTGDGKYEIKALALYNDAAAPGGNGRASATGGRFESVVPALFYSAKREADHVTMRAGEPYVRAGATWYTSATLKNVSSYRRLCILPMVPTLGGNAAAAGPVNIANSDVRAVGGPFAGTLEPDHKVTLSMFVDTAAEGSTSSSVHVVPSAVEIGRNETCNQKTAATLSRLKASDATIVKDSEKFDVHVDVSIPLVTPSSGLTNTVNFFGGVGKSLFVDTFEQIASVVALAHSASSTADEYSTLNLVIPGGAYAYGASVKAAQLIYTAGDVYAGYWRNATAAEKDSVFRRAGNFLSSVTGDFFTNAQGAVQDTAAPFMSKLENAYATGDDAQVWNLWGQVGGHVLQQVITLVFVEVLGAKIAASAPELETIAAKSGEEWAAEQSTVAAETSTLSPKTALSAVPPGTALKLGEEEALWGMDATADASLAKIAEEEQVVIGVRGRSPGSVAKLEKGSVWKNEAIKPKNVNDVDVQWLGFKQSDLSEVRFRTYTPAQETAIRERVAAANLPEAEKTAILDRFDTRLGEKKYIPTIEGYAKNGEINVGFNYRDNGINRASTRQIRKFDLLRSPAPTEASLPAGGTYYTPLQENLNLFNLRKGGVLPPDCHRLLASVLCTITGDVDGVYITAVDGGAVSPTRMEAIYAKLQAAGWQHPETLTWINNQGEFLFGAKSKILKGLEQGGGEAMIEFAPDGIRRATYLDLSQSSLLAPNEFRLRVVGGYTSTLARAAAK